MPIIGLTGGIATGKSTVAQLLREHGAVVLSADEAAREVTEPGSPVLTQIASEFGEKTIDAQGRLDRSRLGKIVFSNPEARRRLEAITHPAILQRLGEQIDRVRDRDPQALVVVEVPLLFEAGMESWFDAVIVVAVSPAVQLSRLLSRSGLTEEDALRRISAQAPLSDKVRRATHVVSNDGSPDALRTELDRLWSRLKDEQS